MQLKDGTLEEASIAYILHEVVAALAYLHSELRMHRDLKAANILLSAIGDVKMSGAALSRLVEQLMPVTCCTHAAGSSQTLVLDP